MITTFLAGSYLNANAWSIEKPLDFSKEEKDVRNTTKKTEKDVRNTAKKTEKDVKKASDKAINDFGQAAGEALQDSGKVVGSTVSGAVTIVDSGLKEITKPITESDANKQISEAIQASATFAEDQLKSVDKSLKENEKRLRQGKVLDAMYHVGADQITSTSSNSAKAVASSALLNQVATAAVSAYGGPTGAAAYASWLTYETTGDLDAAMKAGVLAGASAYLQSNDVMNGVPEEMKQEIAKFSVNASAIAASGGNEKDIIKAFEIQAKAAAVQKLSDLGQDYVTDLTSNIQNKTEISNAPGSWDNLTIVEKAKEVKKSYNQYKKDMKETILNKTKIDVETLEINS